MSTIVTRAGKGSPLTNTEMDSNLTNLNTDKYQSGDSPTFTLVNGLTVGKGGGAVANNTAIGASSLNATNTGTGLNTAVGAFSLYTNTSGSESVAIGYEALRLNTTGTYNVALGQGSLRSNTTAQENTAVGNNSMRTNTTGASNSALGAAALFANTTGSSNTALGYNALVANTTASNNTAVGYQAGYTNSLSSYNVFLGNQAGYTHNLGSLGNGLNTCVGNASGYSLTTGTLNQFLGSGSGYYISSGSKNTILGGYNGNQGSLDIRTSSNYVVLSDGDGNPLISTNSTRSVALNGATPQTGTGITFPATQSASSDANTLDDYEEGTFTPTATASSPGVTPPTFQYSGQYTKIGRLVILTGYIYINSAGTASGTINISGFPFTTANNAYGPIGIACEQALTNVFNQIRVNNNNTTGFIAATTGGGVVWTTGANYIYQITYSI